MSTDGIAFGQHKDGGFLSRCKEYLKAELFNKYDSQLSQIASSGFKVGIIEYREDAETLALLHDGTLSMPIKHKLPEKVWYFKACFQADPSMEVEILIGQFHGSPDSAPLGMHDGRTWVYYPQSTPAGMKL